MKKQRNFNRISGRFFHGNEFVEDGTGKSNYSRREIHTHSKTSMEAKVTVYFDDIEELYVNLAKKHEVAVGAVAWLTNPAILNAFASMQRVGIVVTKEDFLRRDLDSAPTDSWRATLRRQYESLNPFCYDDFQASYPGQQEFNPHYNDIAQDWLFNASGEYLIDNQAVRCIGYTSTTTKLIPRMHHKFVIFGDRHDGLIVVPRCIVTGSFNLTKNAVSSRENALLIEDERMCQSYLAEWSQLWSLSESLDWTSPEPSEIQHDVST